MHDLGHPTLAERAGLEPEIMRDLEAGGRAWTLREIVAVTLGLGELLPTVFAPWDTQPVVTPPSRAV